MITVSGGIATFPEDAANAEDLLRRADEALYRSKAAGKNRITLRAEDRAGNVSRSKRYTRR